MDSSESKNSKHPLHYTKNEFSMKNFFGKCEQSAVSYGLSQIY